MVVAATMTAPRGRSSRAQAPVRVRRHQERIRENTVLAAPPVVDGPIEEANMCEEEAMVTLALGTEAKKETETTPLGGGKPTIPAPLGAPASHTHPQPPPGSRTSREDGRTAHLCRPHSARRQSSPSPSRCAQGRARWLSSTLAERPLGATLKVSTPCIIESKHKHFKAYARYMLHKVDA